MEEADAIDSAAAHNQALLYLASVLVALFISLFSDFLLPVLGRSRCRRSPGLPPRPASSANRRAGARTSLY